MKNNKVKGYIFSFLIITLGMSLIFFSVKNEKNKILKERENFNIITDLNKNDILKIEKKVLDINNIKQILVEKNGSENVYRIEDKNLISDLISGFVFEKFTYSPNSKMESEDWFIEIGVGLNLMKFTFSNNSNIVKLNYNQRDFILEVDEEFYNFIYKFFEGLES